MDPFYNVITTEEAWKILGEFNPLDTETVPLDRALGRVLAQTIRAPEDLPGFARSTVDGYAVRSRDTFGGTEQLPSLLTVAGEIPMGKGAGFPLGRGEAARIATGGMLPDRSDAVVMVEHTRPLDGDLVEIIRPVSPGENVIERGEDVREGAEVLPAGKRIRPQELGLLAGLGIPRVPVRRRPRVAIVSTGDELVPVTERPGPGEIRDINSHTLAALAAQAGAEVERLGRVPDALHALRTKIAEGLERCDVVLVSGGSSVGARDYTLSAFDSLPGAELLIRGIGIRPGKPTLLARVGNKAVWGMPGHVASAMVVFLVFVRFHLRVLAGMDPHQEDPFARVPARLSRNIESAQGRDDFIRVRLQPENGGWAAVPVLGKSGLISTLVEADGLLRIDRNTEGLYQGDRVMVWNLNSDTEIRT